MAPQSKKEKSVSSVPLLTKMFSEQKTFSPLSFPHQEEERKLIWLCVNVCLSVFMFMNLG